MGKVPLFIFAAARVTADVAFIALVAGSVRKIIKQYVWH